jgi:hypothetical protein
LDIWLSNGEPKSEPKGEPKKCLTSTVGGDKEGIPQKKLESVILIYSNLDPTNLEGLNILR